MATKPFLEQLFDASAPDAPATGRHAHGDARVDVEPCSCGLESGASAHVYNEEAFRYFLDIERKRSELSNRPFLLLLLDVRKRSLATNDVDQAAADRLFAALSACLRETDFIGWYRARSVIGAVLTQHADSVGPEVQEAVRDRVVDTIRTSLPADLGARVQVRVYRLPSMTQDTV